VDNNKMDVRKSNGVVWTGLMWLRRERPLEGSCENSNELSGSIKCLEIIE
jgi:hypothetical protein